MLTFLNKNWTILLIAGLALYIVYSGNRDNSTTKNDDRIDSILRVLSIPQKVGTFSNESPQPTIIVVPQPGNTNSGMNNEMLRAFEAMKDDNAKTRAYAEAIARKLYSNVYSDSLVSIKVDDVVEGGILKNQKVDWTVKPQKIEYFESIYYMKPKYTITAGAKLGMAMDSAGYIRPQLLPTIGFKGRNGWTYEGSVNLLNTKEFMIGVSKDVFTKYEKIPEKK